MRYWRVHGRFEGRARVLRFKLYEKTRDEASEARRAPLETCEGMSRKIRLVGSRKGASEIWCVEEEQILLLE